MKPHHLLFLVLLLNSGCASQHREGKHLFILSGQSNMWMLDLNLSFAPTIEQQFGKENVIILKDAEADQPLYKWSKKWRSAEGKVPEASGQLYDRLMEKVNLTVGEQPIQTITFIWMQGETDARDQYGALYAAGLQGLYKQLQKDLDRKDINFVIGRLSDFDMENNVFDDWTKVRDAQMEVAGSNSRFCWVMTDDLNDNIRKPRRRRNNDLHYSPEGYRILGQRFADYAIELINNHQNGLHCQRPLT